MRTIVVNVRDPAHQALINEAKAEGRYVAIHRPSKWGNPFSHHDVSLAIYKVATVDEAIRRHAEWLLEQPHLLADLHQLRGCVLGCYCAPRPCHGYTLARLADDA